MIATAPGSSQSPNAPSAGAPPKNGYYSSFGNVRRAHQALLAARRSESDRPSPERIARFVRDVRDSGKFLKDEAEREAARNILDYWTAELITLGEVPESVSSPPDLAPYAPGAAAGVPSDEDSADKSRAEQVHGDRERTRIAAAARQWKASGKAPGYLLSGKALDEAMLHAKSDPDIDLLVKASKEEAERVRLSERQRSRRFVQGLLGVIVVLLVLAGYALWERGNAIEQSKQANRERDEARAILDAATLSVDARNKAILRLAEAYRIEAGVLERLTDLTLAELGIPTPIPEAMNPPPEVSPRSYTVFVQFAGLLSREDVRTMMSQLADSGWKVQGVSGGGERLGAAAGLNEIRYGDIADRPAATALAAAVEAAGLVDAKIGVPLRPTAGIEPGNLEVWVSRI